MATRPRAGLLNRSATWSAIQQENANRRSCQVAELETSSHRPSSARSQVRCGTLRRRRHRLAPYPGRASAALTGHRTGRIGRRRRHALTFAHAEGASEAPEQWPARSSRGCLSSSGPEPRRRQTWAGSIQHWARDAKHRSRATLAAITARASALNARSCMVLLLKTPRKERRFSPPRAFRRKWCCSVELAPRPGLEPGTCGLTVRRSTN